MTKCFNIHVQSHWIHSKMDGYYGLVLISDQNRVWLTRTRTMLPYLSNPSPGVGVNFLYGVMQPASCPLYSVNATHSYNGKWIKLSYNGE